MNPPKPDDVVLWPDGTWCFYMDLSEYAWMSDDYQIIPAVEWEARNED